MKIGDLVRINCPPSHYHGVVGEIYDIQESTEYAIVDLPKGTEERLEHITQNVIIEQMKRSEKARKTPILRRPKGDPQWFPLRWLVAADPEEAKSRAAALDHT